MKNIIVALAAGVCLSACGGGNPFTEDTTTGTGTTTTTTTTNTGINGDRVVPPGTGNATAQVSIFRSEPTSTESGREGNGFATGIVYDSTADTFTVDNLGFDGDNTFARVTTAGVQANIPFAVYEADAVFLDSVTNAPISQLPHNAIYGVSPTGNTQFAIVRTGAYRDYGFGGFVYQRNNDVTLPSTGQAAYTGQSTGIRDRIGNGGIDYTRADVQIAIDFDDFNATTGTRGDAVRGSVFNRQIFDTDGNNITADVLSRTRTDLNLTNAQLSSIPDLTFVIEPGVLDDNGELIGTLDSVYQDSNGEVQTFETGNYYAVISGADADQEIVGVFVVEGSTDPLASTTRETSGFIVYR
ncbi:MAG: hypothetical protein ACU0BB_04310 [Paracoccaceae bacterium]|jgi:hypothetical protein